MTEQAIDNCCIKDLPYSMPQEEQELYKKELDTRNFIDWFYWKIKPFKTVSKEKLQNIVSKKGFQALVNEMVSINTKAKTTINDNLIITKANGVYGMKVPFLQEPPIPIEEPDFYFEGNHFTEITKSAEDCIAVHDFSKEEISEFITRNDIPNGKIADVINLMYEERVSNSV